MFRILILICSLVLDHGACKRDTARAFVEGPHVASAIWCGVVGQSTVGQLAKEAQPDPKHEYLKIVCELTAR